MTPSTSLEELQSVNVSLLCISLTWHYSPFGLNRLGATLGRCKGPGAVVIKGVEQAIKCMRKPTETSTYDQVSSDVARVSLSTLVLGVCRAVGNKHVVL